jgi:hypothetical protein
VIAICEIAILSARWRSASANSRSAGPPVRLDARRRWGRCIKIPPTPPQGEVGIYYLRSHVLHRSTGRSRPHLGLPIGGAIGGSRQPFRNLSHLCANLSLSHLSPTRTGFGATRCRVAVAVLSGVEPVAPSKPERLKPPDGTGGFSAPRTGLASPSKLSSRASPGAHSGHSEPGSTPDSANPTPNQRCAIRLRTRSAKSRSLAISAIKARKIAEPGTNQSSAVRRKNA